MRKPFTFFVGSVVILLVAGISNSDTARKGPPPTGLTTSAVCIDCHTELSPGIVSDWRLSKHSTEDVACADCHGEGHTTSEDVADVEIPTPETCAQCHEERVEEFSRGKHAKAWDVLGALPTIHSLPSPVVDGMKGCGGCHKIGLKSEEEIKRLKHDGGGGFGVASCDACHTRHTFSLKEARAPQACKTCHNGPDHPQWDMYASSKHGVRYLLKQSGVLHEDVSAPTCQTCHMQDGSHDVNAAWGFMAVRLPLPEDSAWAADQATIFKALGALDPDGQLTDLAAGLVALEVVKTTEEEWYTRRDRMTQTCSGCHSLNFAKEQLDLGDEMIRNADRLMAEAIEIVAGLYADSTLVRSGTYAYAYPDLLTLHDAPSVIELKLFDMFLHHRMRAFQGAFHSSPEFSLWHGWSEMVKDLTEIRELAGNMRE